MQINSSADEAGCVSPDRVRTIVAGMLRAAQVEGWTDDTLAGATGLSPRRIKSYRVENKEPSLSAALSLAVALGPKAINGVLSLIGYVAQPLNDPAEPDVRMMAATLVGHIATIARAAADGRIDHTEEVETREAADALIATVLPIASAGRTA